MDCSNAAARKLVVAVTASEILAAVVLLFPFLCLFAFEQDMTKLFVCASCSPAPAFHNGGCSCSEPEGRRLLVWCVGSLVPCPV